MAGKQSEGKKLGVLMIDFSPVVREGMQSILAKYDEIEFMGDASDGHQALPNMSVHIHAKNESLTLLS